MPAAAPPRGRSQLGSGPALAHESFAHAEDWLRRVGLAAFGDRYPHQLRDEVPKG